MRSSARGIGGGAKRCTLGKSCGATCIDARERCELELGPLVSAEITRARGMLEARVNAGVVKVREEFQPFPNEKATIDYLANNYKQLASEGMEDNYYGSVGQRGNIRSKVWLIGQEAYVRPNDFYPAGANRQDVDREVEKDPVKMLSIVKLLRDMHSKAREIAPKQNVELGVEHMLYDKKGKFQFNPEGAFKVNLDDWVKDKPNTYFGRMGRMLKDLGYSGSLAAGNLSSLLQPPRQKGSAAIVEMLKRNGVNPKTFAEGAFASKDSWYRYSAQQRAPKILRAVEKLKPELLYMGEQGDPEKKNATNFLMYQMAKQMGAPIYRHRQNFGEGGNVDVKYMVVEHGNGKRTVLFNGPHPTGPGLRSKVKQEYIKDFIRSLRQTGEPPTGVVKEPVGQNVMDKVLGAKGGVAAQATPKPMAKSPAKVAAKAQKEMALPKVAAKADAGAARQKLNGYVQTLRNQGQSPNQIKEQLRKMGIPAGLISELV